MNTLIAYLSPLYLTDGSSLPPQAESLVDLARRVVEHERGACAVEVIAFGPEGWEQVLAPGVRLRVLPIAYHGGHPLDVLSWDLPLALARAEVVHIHQANTRTGEMGLLLTRLHRKPVCLSVQGQGSSGLGEAIDFTSLADCIVELGDPADDAPRLARLYRRLAGGLEEAA